MLTALNTHLTEDTYATIHAGKGSSLQDHQPTVTESMKKNIQHMKKDIQHMQKNIQHDMGCGAEIFYE